MRSAFPALFRSARTRSAARSQHAPRRIKARGEVRFGHFVCGGERGRLGCRAVGRATRYDSGNLISLYGNGSMRARWWLRSLLLFNLRGSDAERFPEAFRHRFAALCGRGARCEGWGRGMGGGRPGMSPQT